MRSVNKCLLGRWQRVGLSVRLFGYELVLDLVGERVLCELSSVLLCEMCISLKRETSSCFSVEDVLLARSDVLSLLRVLLGGMFSEESTQYFHLWRSLIRESDVRYYKKDGDYRYNPLKHGRDQNVRHDDLLEMLVKRGGCIKTLKESSRIAVKVLDSKKILEGRRDIRLTGEGYQLSLLKISFFKNLIVNLS